MKCTYVSRVCILCAYNFSKWSRVVGIGNRGSKILNRLLDSIQKVQVTCIFRPRHMRLKYSQHIEFSCKYFIFQSVNSPYIGNPLYAYAYVCICVRQSKWRNKSSSWFALYNPWNMLIHIEISFLLIQRMMSRTFAFMMTCIILSNHNHFLYLSQLNVRNPMIPMSCDNFLCF